MDHPFTNDRPIYVQLVERVEQAILTGQCRPDEKLPSVREFASMYQVNPNTMQKALQELERKKLIYTERTNGKFVSDNCSLIEKARDQHAAEIVRRCLGELDALGYGVEEAIALLKKGE